MTDLEMTKLCAEAMGIGIMPTPDNQPADSIWYTGDNGHWSQILHYDPLHDDAQAMALVKKCELIILKPLGWNVASEKWWRETDEFAVIPPDAPFAAGKDLNRAIVECVAKMQAAEVNT